MRCLTRLAVAWVMGCCTLLPGQDSAANGKKLFSKYGCYECHGTQGQGTTAGARLAPKPIALPALIAYVRRPSGQMPPYTGKVVSDAELSDIRAYLASIPEPTPAKSIPLLNQ
ncbi:MAG: cytochrome c, mono- and diheme variant family [Bryobacterales bacterium]|nr:cytochrome c, mono- and diheme variant family [Bryobacterales bacterium]